MMASEAEEDVTAAASAPLYPRRFIAGISTEPVAATSATADPEISAKNIDTPTLTIARPPRTKPISAETKAMRRREMLDVFISVPARMNKGMAINGKLVAASNNVRAAL